MYAFFLFIFNLKLTFKKKIIKLIKIKGRTICLNGTVIYMLLN